MVNKMKMGTAKPETTARVLYQVRAEIVREDRDGPEHADALMRARGLGPEAFVVPDTRERKSFIGRGTRQRAGIDALREGPATLREVCDRVRAKNPARTSGPSITRLPSALEVLSGAGLCGLRG